MKYLSVCSGIEAATVAWRPLGWRAVGFSEIEPFPSAVLAHHHPAVPNLGDMTNFREWRLNEAIDVVVGGTPCQAFSVAGRRESLSDERGNLTLTFCDIVDHFRPSFVVWENVPGALNTKDNAFGCFVGRLAGESNELKPSGKRWTNAGVVFGPQRTVAWRVLDAQYFGLAQRRKRVFLVASAREDICPAEILFEFDGVRRDIAPSREAGQETSGDAGAGSNQTGFRKLTFESYAQDDLVAFNSRQDPVSGDAFGALDTSSPQAQAIAAATAVRRLTPIECERLQGFPDNYTAIPWRGKPAEDCPDGHRYKALGNSMAVPVMRWIGERIDKFR